MFDTGKTGCIDSSELRALLHTMGQKLDDAEIEAMMHHLDRDGSGSVSFDEWRCVVVVLCVCSSVSLTGAR